MLAYVGRRLLLAVPILVGVSAVVFALVKLTPGDPVAALLGPRATREAAAALNARYGLDKPLPIQFLTWASHVFRGDLGDSISTGRPVLPMVQSALANTLILTASAGVLAVLGGTALAMVVALGQRRVTRQLASIAGNLSISLPQYSLGVVLIVVFAGGLHWLPSAGMTDALTGGGQLRHLLLPTIAAAAIPMGVIARVFAAALHEVSSEGWVDNLRSRGLSRSRIAYHIGRGSVTTLLTIAGLQIGYLLGGAVFVEVVFRWPGCGRLIYESISKRDMPVILAGVLVSALAFVLLNIAVDIARASLDPRLRVAGGSA